MYYRVAIQRDAAVRWTWKSTVLSSLETAVQFLRLYRALPPDRLRVFSSCSRGELQAQLEQENTGLASHSVTAAQFLQERRITPQETVREASPRGTRADERTASTPAHTSPSPDENCLSELDKRREELERGAGGDHDLPYRFTLPTSMPQVLAWVKLLVRVRQGDFQPEVGAFDERQPQHPGGSSTPTYVPYGKKLARCVFTATTESTTSG